MKKLLTLAAATTFVSTAAFAETPEFATVDADTDGVVTMEELKDALPDLDEAKAVAADADASGDFSEEEYTALIEMLEADSEAVEDTTG